MAAVRKERRFEDVISDEDEEEDFVPNFLQKGKGVSSTNGSQTKKGIHTSPPRKPRSTLHEQVGEDGFIFSIAADTKHAKSTIPGAKGHPPTQSKTTVREKIAEAETPFIRRNQQKRAQADASTSEEEHFRPNGTNKRQPSDSVRRIRRTSQLQDGTPAYPHSSIPDEDLHNYCSGDMEPHERLKHVAGWILERRREEVKGKMREESHKAPLLAALKATLRDLNKGAVQTQRPSTGEQQKHPGSSSSSQSSNGMSKKRRKLPAHPRNEANKEKKRKLEEVVHSLKREKEAWESERKELDVMRRETEGIVIPEGVDESADASTDDVSDSLEGGSHWTAEDKLRLKLVRRALESERHRAAKAQHKESDESGTEEDPRWKDVEFNADLLRSKTHTFAQLSSLSQRYIAAVSARGAKALKEMTQGPSRLLRGNGGTSSSIISRDSRDNLDQILSEIRTITEGAGSDEEGVIIDRGHAVGDVSEGEILRAYAQMS